MTITDQFFFDLFFYVEKIKINNFVSEDETFFISYEIYPIICVLLSNWASDYLLTLQQQYLTHILSTSMDRSQKITQRKQKCLKHIFEHKLIIFLCLQHKRSDQNHLSVV